MTLSSWITCLIERKSDRKIRTIMKGRNSTIYMYTTQIWATFSCTQIVSVCTHLLKRVSHIWVVCRDFDYHRIEWAVTALAIIVKLNLNLMMTYKCKICGWKLTDLRLQCSALKDPDNTPSRDQIWLSLRSPREKYQIMQNSSKISCELMHAIILRRWVI